MYTGILGHLEYNAKSCFDRIFCNLVMLNSRYNGIPLNFCKIQAKTLKRTIFKLWTALGDSTTTYQNSAENPIHGTGQGSCASPAIWLMLSRFLMQILKYNGMGMTMENILTNDCIVCEIIEGFVDDTSIFTNSSKEDLKHLLLELEKDGNRWLNLLECSGGLLELEKCFCYLWSWY
jgi:hypothetical protein